MFNTGVYNLSRLALSSHHSFFTIKLFFHSYKYIFCTSSPQKISFSSDLGHFINKIYFFIKIIFQKDFFSKFDQIDDCSISKFDSDFLTFHTF